MTLSAQIKPTKVPLKPWLLKIGSFFIGGVQVTNYAAPNNNAAAPNRSRLADVRPVPIPANKRNAPR
jgi:hypothetical protein